MVETEKMRAEKRFNISSKEFNKLVNLYKEDMFSDEFAVSRFKDVVRFHKYLETMLKKLRLLQLDDFNKKLCKSVEHELERLKMFSTRTLIRDVYKSEESRNRVATLMATIELSLEKKKSWKDRAIKWFKSLRG